MDERKVNFKKQHWNLSRSNTYFPHFDTEDSNVFKDMCSTFIVSSQSFEVQCQNIKTHSFTVFATFTSYDVCYVIHDRFFVTKV